MLKQAKQFLSKSWAVILGVIGLLLVALRMKSKYDGALIKERLFESENEDARLNERSRLVKKAKESIKGKKDKELSEAKSKSKKKVEEFYND